MSLSEQEHRDLVASFPRARLVPFYVAAILVFGLGGIGAMLLGSNSHRANAMGVGPLLVGLIGVGIFATLLVRHLQHVRMQSLALVAARLSLDYVVKPIRAARAGFFAPFLALPMLKTGHKGVKLWMGGELSGRRLDLVEHAYVVSTGKSAHVVTHTAIATPVPPAWPRLSLSSRHVLASWWASVTGKDFKVENEAFNARWIIKTDTPDFALLFLTPEVQQFLADAPSAETWHVAPGSLCLLVRKQLKPRDLPRPLVRVADLRNLLPPELDYWGVSPDNP